MWEAGQRIKILAGHYGSGKTELALNMARTLREGGARVTLVDLDIVNPFFRSAERKDWLNAAGIRLIAPEFALTGVDVPSLPADIASVFERKDEYAIFDVGGDDAGARALGQYQRQFEQSGYDLLYVVNIFRPRSNDAPAIIEMMRRVAAWARLTPSALINNSNLAEETTSVELLAGLSVLRQVTAETGVPVLASVGLPRAIDGVPGATFAMERLMKPEWMDAP